MQGQGSRASREWYSARQRAPLHPIAQWDDQTLQVAGFFRSDGADPRERV